MNTTLQLLAATFGILAIASCTAYVDPNGVGANRTTTTTTSTDSPYIGGDTTVRETTTTRY